MPEPENATVLGIAGVAVAVNVPEPEKFTVPTVTAGVRLEVSVPDPEKLAEADKSRVNENALVRLATDVSVES